MADPCHSQSVLTLQSPQTLQSFAELPLQSPASLRTHTHTMKAVITLLVLALLHLSFTEEQRSLEVPSVPGLQVLASRQVREARKRGNKQGQRKRKQNNAGRNIKGRSKNTNKKGITNNENKKEQKNKKTEIKERTQITQKER